MVPTSPGTLSALPDGLALLPHVGFSITHGNGFAVNTVEEVLCAVSLAKNKADVQIVLKDVDTGKRIVSHVTATTR